MNIDLQTEAECEGYWGPDELESVSACPACKSVVTGYRYQNLKDHLGGVPGRWGFRECADCGSLFLDPRPTPSAIGKAYSSEAYFTHESGEARNADDNGDSIAWRLANGYLNSRFGCDRQPSNAGGRWLVPIVVPIRQQLEFFYRHLPRRTGTLLDVGCGNGAFMLRAAAAGWSVQGIEPDPAAAAMAIAAGLSVHQGDMSTFECPHAFDVVTLSHVFEHLHDPVGALTMCGQVLRPGGVLWMAMPNIEGLGHRVYGKAWFPLDPPRHLFLPSMRKLEQMCRDSGFSRVQFVRRGRFGRSAVRECAERATLLDVKTGPGWVWHMVINALSVLSTRWSEELVVLAVKDKA